MGASVCRLYTLLHNIRGVEYDGLTKTTNDAGVLLQDSLDSATFVRRNNLSPFPSSYWG